MGLKLWNNYLSIVTHQYMLSHIIQLWSYVYQRDIYVSSLYSTSR